MSTITDGSDLRPIEEAAQFCRVDAKKLRRGFRERMGSPTMVRLAREVWLVDWAEFLAWLNRQRASGPEADDMARRIRPARSEAARRRRVRVADQRRGPSEGGAPES